MVNKLDVKEIPAKGKNKGTIEMVNELEVNEITSKERKSLYGDKPDKLEQTAGGKCISTRNLSGNNI